MDQHCDDMCRLWGGVIENRMLRSHSEVVSACQVIRVKGELAVSFTLHCRHSDAWLLPTLNHETGRNERPLLSIQNHTNGLPGSGPWRTTADAALPNYISLQSNGMNAPTLSGTVVCQSGVAYQQARGLISADPSDSWGTLSHLQRKRKNRFNVQVD